MKSRIVASGVVALAMASVAVPAALSGSASAATTAAPAITVCAPIPATIGKTVTVKGSGLAKATSVTLGGKKVAKFQDKAKKISFKVPKGTSTTKKVTVAVKTANGSASIKLRLPGGTLKQHSFKEHAVSKM